MSTVENHISGRRWKRLLRLAGLLSVAMLWPLTSAHAAVYSFNMLGPMYSSNSDGDVIRLNGSGTFDTISGAVEAHGSYSIRNSAGAVVERGTWAATQFVSFESDGGINNGLQGGEVSLVVTLTPDGGSPEIGIPFTLVCPYDNGVFDGPGCDLLIGDFTTSVGGLMVFHLVQP